MLTEESFFQKAVQSSINQSEVHVPPHTIRVPLRIYSVFCRNMRKLPHSNFKIHVWNAGQILIFVLVRENLVQWVYPALVGKCYSHFLSETISLFALLYFYLSISSDILVE